MAWKLEDVRIFLQSLGNTEEKVIALLQPIDGYTVIQLLGNKVPTYNIEYYIVGDADKRKLNQYVYSGSLVTLSGPDGIVGDFYMHNAKFERQMVISQTIRTDLEVDDKVYVVNSELYENV